MFRNQSWQDDSTMNQTLLPRDLEYCKERAISPEIATKARLFSVTKNEAASLLGRSRFPSSGLVIPYLPTSEGSEAHCRIRLHNPMTRGDGKPQRWMMPGGIGARPYILPWIPKEEWQVTAPVIVVEGPPKALSVNGNTNILTLALGGVETAHDKEALDAGIERLHPEILNLRDWKDQEVFLCMDSNRSTKAGVLRGEKRTARCFAAAGAKVYIIELPHGAQDKEQGPDDFIAANGSRAFLSLMDAARTAEAVHEPIKEIIMRLKRGKNDAPKPCLFNLTLILDMDPSWEGLIAQDLFANRIIMKRTPPWDSQVAPDEKQGPGTEWKDADDVRLAVWFDSKWGISASPEMCSAAVNTMGFTNEFHPVREYLGSIAWDQTPRLQNWMQHYLGADSKPYTNAVGIKFLVSMVARVMRPGCKADCLPIFEGTQGLRKSTAMRILSKGWFTDQLSDISNKDCAMELQGVWLVELAEFDHLIKYESSALKRFFGKEDDRFRLPYGRRVERIPRQCIFAGTTNHDDYLRDETGARRFWPIKLSDQGINIEELTADIDQLWAEAVHLFQQGEKWWLEGDLAKMAGEEQDSRYQADAWEDLIVDYIELENKKFVIVGDILLNCLNIEVGNWKRSDEMRVSAVLKHLGWVKGREGTGKRRWGYVLRSSLITDPTDPTGSGGTPSGSGGEDVHVQSVSTSKVKKESDEILDRGEKKGPLRSTEVQTVQEPLNLSNPVQEIEVKVALSYENAKVVAIYHQPRTLHAYPLWHQNQLVNIAASAIEGGKNPMMAWGLAMAKATLDEESAF